MWTVVVGIGTVGIDIVVMMAWKGWFGQAQEEVNWSSRSRGGTGVLASSYRTPSPPNSRLR